MYIPPALSPISCTTCTPTRLAALCGERERRRRREREREGGGGGEEGEGKLRGDRDEGRL